MAGLVTPDDEKCHLDSTGKYIRNDHVSKLTSSSSSSSVAAVVATAIEKHFI